MAGKLRYWDCKECGTVNTSTDLCGGRLVICTHCGCGHTIKSDCAYPDVESIGQIPSVSKLELSHVGKFVRLADEDIVFVDMRISAGNGDVCYLFDADDLKARRRQRKAITEFVKYHNWKDRRIPMMQLGRDATRRP